MQDITKINKKDRIQSICRRIENLRESIDLATCSGQVIENLNASELEYTFLANTYNNRGSEGVSLLDIQKVNRMLDMAEAG